MSNHTAVSPQALEYARKAYDEERWLSGEPYFAHAKRVARILADMGLDQASVTAGLLNHAARAADPNVREAQLKEIGVRFGAEVADLVRRTGELNKIYYSLAPGIKPKKALQHEKAENVRRMFFAIAGDIRAVLIKLAARLDGVNYLARFPADMQQRYARETLEIFSPIANRLGLGDLKRKLEDPAFAVLMPDKFQWLQQQLKNRAKTRGQAAAKFAPQLIRLLKHEHIAFASLDWRTKSYWSCWIKLQRHQMDLEKLHDLVAMRLVVKDLAACYKALGIIHEHYPPISGQIQDYIAKPKENGYQSIHTTVHLGNGDISEIQIKTEAMHQEAEHGVCAHWAYKDQLDLRRNQEGLALARQIPDFWKNLKIDFFENQVFCFTPAGDVISLPKGSTAVDFAYALHSEIGNHCEAAKTNGHIIPLSQPLRNGDVVEIITNKKRLPSADWLKFIKTNLAKVHIKRETILKVPSAIFSIPGFLGKQIVEISKKTVAKKPKPATHPQKTISQKLYLAGQKNLQVTMAKCCNPLPGQAAKAYLTKQRSAVLHQISCKNFQKLSQKFPEKVINAAWHQA